MARVTLPTLLKIAGAADKAHRKHQTYFISFVAAEILTARNVAGFVADSDDKSIVAAITAAYDDEGLAVPGAPWFSAARCAALMLSHGEGSPALRALTGLPLPDAPHRGSPRKSDKMWQYGTAPCDPAQWRPTGDYFGRDAFAPPPTAVSGENAPTPAATAEAAQAEAGVKAPAANKGTPPADRPLSAGRAYEAILGATKMGAMLPSQAAEALLKLLPEPLRAALEAVVLAAVPADRALAGFSQATREAVLLAAIDACTTVAEAEAAPEAPAAKVA